MSANVKKVSDYKKQVLNTNAKLKSTHKTLGGCLKNMYHFTDEMGLNSKQKTEVQLLRKNHDLFKAFQKVCRKSKNGNYSPFYVLQAMYKAQKPIKIVTKKVVAEKVVAKKTVAKKRDLVTA